MDDLLVECPIHLDAVSIKDILVFKCGHGFCEPCLEEHFAHLGRSSHNLSCPSCRKPVRRKEAFPIFLAPAHASSQATHSGSSSTPDAAHARLIKELRETKAAHASCSGRFAELQDEVDTLRQDSANNAQTMHYLRSRYEILEERLVKETDHSARAREESIRSKEEVTRLQIENHKISIALEQALKDVQTQLERVKLFQGYIEQYKHKCNLEKKKRKAMENVNHKIQPRKEEESLMVVDANAPDVLVEDEPDFGWLDEACKVKGDQFDLPGNGFESERDSGDEGVSVQFIDPIYKGKRTESEAPQLPLRFHSDWNLGAEDPSSENTRKQRRKGRQLSGSKIVRVKVPVGSGTQKLVGGALAIDRYGRLKGPVALGSRQKFNSKN